MILTKDFLKAFNALIVFSIFLMGLTFWMDATNNLGYSLSDSNTDTRILLNGALRFLIVIGLWMAIGYATKEYKGVIAVLVLKTAVISYFTYSYLSNGFNPELGDSLFWFSLMSSIVTYLLFGLIHFKDKRCLYLLIVFFLLRGISAGANSSGYYEFLNTILRIFNIDDFMEVRITLSDTSYRPVNLFRIIMSRMYLPLNFLIFWFVYSKIKNRSILDLSMRTINMNEGLSKLNYSTIYWTFRLTLIVSAFGIINYLQYAFARSGRIEIVINLLFYCIAIYAVTSMYRNFLSAWFVSKGKYPGWIYFLLNVPFFSFFAWLASIFKSYKTIEPPLFNNEQLGGEETVQPLSKLDQLKKKFRNGNQNQGIKTLIYIFLFLSAVNQLSIFFRYSQPDSLNSIFVILYYLIAVVFTIWYFNDSKALYIQIGIIAFSLLITGALHLESGFSPSTAFGLINLIFYYSLFHFDKLNFLESEATDEEAELNENNLIA